ncbi:MAG: aldo/keto reductase, partial [Oscillospiraceae bacterium]
ELKTPFVVNQPSYSMLNRWIEDCGLDDYAKREGIGIAVYSPLYQGFLTDKYLGGISDAPNAGRGKSYLIEQLTPQMIAKLNKLNGVAKERGQKLSQMALSWILRNGKITTVLMGASTPEQIAENVQAVSKTKFSDEETELIEAILAE